MYVRVPRVAHVSCNLDAADVHQSAAVGVATRGIVRVGLFAFITERSVFASMLIVQYHGQGVHLTRRAHRVQCKFVVQVELSCLIRCRGVRAGVQANQLTVLCY
jgi:hypothetical protein